MKRRGRDVSGAAMPRVMSCMQKRSTCTSDPFDRLLSALEVCSVIAQPTRKRAEEKVCCHSEV
jgi:hypothetical protein